MAGKSGIEWTQHTWNPIAGCSVLTPGCTNCYAMKMAARLAAMGQVAYVGTTKPSKAGPVWTGLMRQAPESALFAPLRRKRPTMYFVNSMSDLFHENVPDEWIDEIFAVMALCPQHTFQVLTKRAERMRDYLSREDLPNRLAWEVTARVMNAWQPGWKSEEINGPHRSRAIAAFTSWPLDNVWLGVSTERQKEADERIPLLLQTPAAVRFISAEPLLGPIALNYCNDTQHCYDALTGTVRTGIRTRPNGPLDSSVVAPGAKLDWIITGGESGPNARPSHPQWFRDIRDACAAAGVPFFFKQWGGWWFDPLTIDAHGSLFHKFDDGTIVERVGKKAAGRLLDGKTHDAMPSQKDHVITKPERRAGGE